MASDSPTLCDDLRDAADFISEIGDDNVGNGLQGRLRAARARLREEMARNMADVATGGDCERAEMCLRLLERINGGPATNPGKGSGDKCVACGGTGRDSNCTGCAGERNSHVATCRIWRDCYTCKGAGRNPEKGSGE